MNTTLTVLIIVVGAVALFTVGCTGDPFLIVSVDKKIMKDHDDIANPVIINFLGEFILFCQSDPLEHTK